MKQFGPRGATFKFSKTDSVGAKVSEFSPSPSLGIQSAGCWGGGGSVLTPGFAISTPDHRREPGSWVTEVTKW